MGRVIEKVVVSRMVEFVFLGGGESDHQLRCHMKRLQELLLRDRCANAVQWESPHCEHEPTQLKEEQVESKGEDGFNVVRGARPIVRSTVGITLRNSFDALAKGDYEAYAPLEEVHLAPLVAVRCAPARPCPGKGVSDDMLLEAAIAEAVEAGKVLCSGFGEDKEAHAPSGPLLLCAAPSAPPSPVSRCDDDCSESHVSDTRETAMAMPSRGDNCERAERGEGGGEAGERGAAGSVGRFPAHTTVPADLDSMHPLSVRERVAVRGEKQVRLCRYCDAAVSDEATYCQSCFELRRMTERLLGKEV